MKTIIKQYCLLVLLVSSSFAQEINFSKDSLNFNFVNNPTYMLSDSVVENNSHLVSKYSLEQNYPNPFNPTTTISYEIKSPDYIELNVFNLLGEKVANLVKEYKMVGRYKIVFNASGLPSGVYLISMETPFGYQVQKSIYLK